MRFKKRIHIKKRIKLTRSEACIFGPKFNALKKYECALKSEFTLKSESNYYAVKPVFLGHNFNTIKKYEYALKSVFILKSESN